MSKWCPPRYNDTTGYFIGKCTYRWRVSKSKPYNNKIPVVIWIKCLLIGLALKSRIRKNANIKHIFNYYFNSVAITIYLLFIFLRLTFMELVFWFKPVKLMFWACKFQETAKISSYIFENNVQSCPISFYCSCCRLVCRN